MQFNFSPLDDFDFSPDEESLKLGLFSRVSKMERLESELKKVEALPLFEKQRWLRKNEDLLQRMIDELMSYSFSVLEAAEGDAQEVELSVEYVRRLRDVTASISSLTYPQQLTTRN